MREELIQQLKSTHEFFERSTGTLNEDDSTFSPSGGMFTASQQVAHVAQTIDWFVDGAFRENGFDMDFEAHEKQVRAVSSLDEARAWLKRAVDNAVGQLSDKSEEDWIQPLPPGPIFGGAPRVSVFWGISDHTAHHRGALTAYARARGKTPPNLYMDMDQASGA